MPGSIRHWWRPLKSLAHDRGCRSRGREVQKGILKRGFSEEDLARHFETLPPSNDLEDQLIADNTIETNFIVEHVGQDTHITTQEPSRVPDYGVW